ncbi:hypothetical protein ACFCW7_17635 [Paenibacillus glucanolyticus]|nr:hypothetical protein [Paenibacillus glucanolyticus]
MIVEGIMAALLRITEENTAAAMGIHVVKALLQITSAGMEIKGMAIIKIEEAAQADDMEPSTSPLTWLRGFFARNVILQQ